METIGKIFTGLILLIITTIISGFIIVKFWLWFVLPVFSVPALNLIQAIGLSFFLRWLVMKKELDKKDDQPIFKKLLKDTITYCILAAMIFVAGWFIHLLY